MMKQSLWRTLLLAVCAAGLTACEDDAGITVTDIVIPEGYALSAGTSTIFVRSSFAYDTEAKWVESSDELEQRFTVGDKLYNNTRTQEQGLGPVYAGYSCGSCHRISGRTTPAGWSDGGSGPYGFSSMLVYVTRKNGTFFPNYGRVIHDQSIIGVDPEGKVKVDWHYQQFQFPDGEPYTLCYPTYTITEWYDYDIRPEDLFCTVRIPLRHVGMGQMMALDPLEIEELARRSNYPEYGISGRCNYITERGRRQLGLSGNKAQHADLTVELGFSSDMGVTNSRFPEEISEGQRQVEQLYDVWYKHYLNIGKSEAEAKAAAWEKLHTLEVSTRDMEDVDLYLHGLGVPARRDVNNLMVQYGEQMFYKAACHLCHVPTLHTRPRGATLLNGTELPWLGGQTIHPYSDFLLHDMGSEIMGVGLNDNYVSGLAQGNEWRTTPLWAIGLQETVNGHTYFLHDGRARDFTEAIMWHGGEAEASKNIFKNMSRDEREALVRFLQSL